LPTTASPNWAPESSSWLIQRSTPNQSQTCCAKSLAGGGGVRVGLFELEQAEPVVVGVDEPGRQGEAEVGDAVDGAQLGEVLDLDAAGAQLRAPGGEGGPPP